MKSHRQASSARQSAMHRRKAAAAFRNIAHGCSPQTALARTKAFYRSSGADCTRHLT